VFIYNLSRYAVLCALMFPVSAQNLYFITGTPTPKVNAAFDTILYRLDAASGATSKIRDLVAPGNGSNFIETSWDNRTLIMDILISDPRLWRLSRSTRSPSQKPSR